MKIKKAALVLTLSVLALISANHLKAHEPYVSEEIIVAIEELLMQMPTIFLPGYNIPLAGPISASGEWVYIDGEYIYESVWTAYEGEYIIGFDWESGQHIVTTETPILYLMPMWMGGNDWGFFDRYGNRLLGAPWLHYDLYATWFSLWDFEGNGVPFVRIHFEGHRVNGGGSMVARLFRFLDGEFRLVLSEAALFRANPNRIVTDWFPWERHLFDDENNFIGYFYEHISSTLYFYQITFDGELSYAELIAQGRFDWDYWEERGGSRFLWNHYMLEYFDFIAPAPVVWESYYLNVPWFQNDLPYVFIPGCNTRLTIIQPLDELRDSIAASVTQRFLEKEMTLPELMMKHVTEIIVRAVPPEYDAEYYYEYIFTPEDSDDVQNIVEVFEVLVDPTPEYTQSNFLSMLILGFIGVIIAGAIFLVIVVMKK